MRILGKGVFVISESRVRIPCLPFVIKIIMSMLFILFMRENSSSGFNVCVLETMIFQIIIVLACSSFFHISFSYDCSLGLE